MGYYTEFDVDIYQEENFPDGRALSDDESAELWDSEISDNAPDWSSLDESHKWYDYDKNMKTLSKACPHHVFMVAGDGEGDDDNWMEVFYNGKSTSVSAVLTYPPMDLSKIGLTDPKDPTAPEEEPENQFFFSK